MTRGRPKDPHPERHHLRQLTQCRKKTKIPQCPSASRIDTTILFQPKYQILFSLSILVEILAICIIKASHSSQGLPMLPEA